MGIYLNPGKTAYEAAVQSEIFVDKTEMIQYLNTVVRTEQRYVCVSRPRRFGKTMAANMLCAYYGRGAGSHALFAGMKLAAYAPVKAGGREIRWDAQLGQFDVLRLVMTNYFKKGLPVEKSLEKLQRLAARDIKKAYPDADYFDTADLAQTMEDLYAHNGHQFVVIIDEWDAVFREHAGDAEGQGAYLDFLRDWLKDKEYVALAYMTGILPIKKYGRHSALNMFDEYSMLQPMQLAKYTGFTEQEVRSLCDAYEMEFADVSNWYNGYILSDAIPVAKRKLYRLGQYENHKLAIYSPLSVVKAMRNGTVENYWNRTETYEALAEYIRRDYDGLKDTVALLMDGGQVRVDTSTYQNDMTTFGGRDDVLTLLVHLGYLGYDSEAGRAFIPNREILEEFKASTKSGEWDSAFAQWKASVELLEATWARDGRKVGRMLEEAHDRAGNRSYNGEAALGYAVQLAYYAAQKYYTTVLELDTGKGYADIAYLPSPRYPEKPALLIELKYNKDADTALSQIRRRNYPDRLGHYKGNLLLVAINYDKDAKRQSPDFKRHTCKIEDA